MEMNIDGLVVWTDFKIHDYLLVETLLEVVLQQPWSLSMTPPHQWLAPLDTTPLL